MDIKELLESDEGKAAITAAVEEATKGLKTKNDELLGKLKDKDAKLTEKEQREKELEEARIKAEEEAALKSGDSEKITKTFEEKMAKLQADYDAKLKDKDGQLQSLLVDNGLTDALTKANVAPQYMEDVRLSLKARYSPKIEEVDGKPVARIEGKDLNDFVSEWSQGDHGKHYIAAPNNGGGGANGTNGGGKAPTGKKRADMSVKEKTAFIRENGQEAYNQLS